jgi:enoyl-CoA hydratase/carnithine racemase
LDGGLVTDHAEEAVAVEAQDGLLRVVINRPDRKGSLDVAAVRRMVETLERRRRTTRSG